jgi:hypothetical protein
MPSAGNDDRGWCLGRRNAEPRWKAEADLQQIAAFDPNAFDYSSQDRLVLPHTGPLIDARGWLRAVEGRHSHPSKERIS